MERDATRTHEKRHGRIETRHLTSTTALYGYSDWPGLRQVIRVRRRRENTATGKVERSVVYFVTSLAREQAAARQLLSAIRCHWGVIENGLHWVRDHIYQEDKSTVCTGHAPQNLATARNSALNWLRANGVDKLTSKIRSFQRNSLSLLSNLGYPY